MPGMSVLQCVTRFLGMDIAPEIFEMPVRHVGAWRVPRLLVCHGLRLDLVRQEYVDQMRGYEIAGAFSSTNLERVCAARIAYCTTCGWKVPYYYSSSIQPSIKILV